MQDFINLTEPIQTSNFQIEPNGSEVRNHYKFMKGKVILTGKQPDGDSVAFVADNYSLFADLDRGYLANPPKRDGSIQLRFEGIDTPELHYERGGTFFQPLGEEARDYLLNNFIGFQKISYKESADAGYPPMTVSSSEPDSIPIAIVTKALEPHGRPISYLFKDLNKFGDGAIISIDESLLQESINFKMLQSGYAFLLAYDSMPVLHYKILKEAANEAREKKVGVWQVDMTADFKLSDFDSINGKDSQLIYPKLFRRCIDFLKSGGKDLKEWLRANEKENDQVRITPETIVTLSSLVRQENDTIYFQADTNDIIFIEK